MKSYKNLIFITSLICIDITCFSQHMPVTTTIRTPQGNVPHTYYVPTPKYNHPQYAKSMMSVKYDFTIELRNDSSFTAKTKINISDDVHFVRVKMNNVKREIRPNETKSISRITSNGHKLIGIPADTCWLFKVGSGRINSYSSVAEEGLLYVIAIQEGNGQIIPLMKETLQPIVWEDPKILAMVEHGSFARAIEAYNEKEASERKK